MVKKRLRRRCLSLNFVKFFEKTFWQNATHAANRKENLYNWITILIKISRRTFHGKTFLTWFRNEFVSCIFPKILAKLTIVSFSAVVVFLFKLSSWSIFNANIITCSGVMTIFVYKGLTRNPEIGNTPFRPISGDWGKLWIPNLVRIRLMKSSECYKMPDLQLLPFLKD